MSMAGRLRVLDDFTGFFSGSWYRFLLLGVLGFGVGPESRPLLGLKFLFSFECLILGNLAGSW